MKVFQQALSLCLFITLANISFAKKELELVEWKNPTPSFSELDLDIETVADIIGNGQLIISHKQKSITLWTQGEEKTYHNVRFSSAMTIVNAPAQELRTLVANTENYGDFMPQVRDSSIPLKSEQHFLAFYTQQYNMGPFPIKARFQWQHTYETNGDISILLHEGDIDAATGRYEFIPVNEKQTLLVLTTWQDLDTAKLTYRMLIKANPDFKAAFPAVAATMLLLHFKEVFEKETQASQNAESLPDHPNIPLLTQRPKHLNTLIRLAENGTLVLIEEKQWYRDKNNHDELQGIVFASAIRVMPVNVEKAKPLILDMNALPEFTKEIKKVEISDIQNGKHVEAKLKIGLGVVGISLDFYFDIVNYEASEDIRLLTNGGGDMYPMLGAYEFAGYERDGQHYTFGVLTQGGSISDSAPFMVKLIAKKLPQFDFIRTIFSTLPQIEKQQAWVMQQLESP